MSGASNVLAFSPGFNADEARAYFAAIIDGARGILGKLVIASLKDKQFVVRHVQNDSAALDMLVEIAGEWTREGRNVYFAGALFRNDLEPGKKGEEGDVIAVLGLTQDFDDDRAEEYASRMPVPADIVVNTSAGRYQCTVLFQKPLRPAKAKPLAVALKRATGCDACSSDVSHVWRVPGTFNYPSDAKLKKGRAREPQPCRLVHVASALDDRVSSTDLGAAITLAKPDAFHSADPRVQGNSADFDWDQRANPNKEREVLGDVAIIKALEKEGDRSSAAFSLLVRLRRKNYSPQEVLEAVAQFAHKPVMQHYMGRDDWEDALRADIKRAFTKPLMTKETGAIARIEYSRAEDGAKLQYPEVRVVKIVGGALAQNVQDAEAALIEQCSPVFQRGGMIVRPTDTKIEVRDGKEAGDLVLERVAAPAMAHHMTNAAHFVKWDGRSCEWKEINCPREVVDAYLAGGIDWNLRVLSGVVNAPTLRTDGTLLDRPGYDAATGLLYDPRGVEFPPIPAHPTQDEAKLALATFDELIGEFPFATREARAVALSGFLTVCVRRTLRAAPMIAIDGTGAGSGKGLLCDTTTVVGTGRPPSPINAGANEEELEKRIASMMIRGDAVIAVDNLDAPLESSFLCSVLTQETVSPRVLGQSKNLNLPTRHLFMATGNALTLVGDLNRRALVCLIDPKMENPSERAFTFDPVERALRDRPRYVAAALTVLRAYQVAGRPKQAGKVMGSFGDWCRTVRDALLWLGEADPAVTCVPSNPDDPERERFAAVATSWKAVIGIGVPVSAKQAADIAMDAAAPMDGTTARPELREALLAVAAPMARGSLVSIEPRLLGDWLRKKKRLVVGGLRFYPGSAGNQGRRWRLEDVTAQSEGGSDDDLL